MPVISSSKGWSKTYTSVTKITTRNLATGVTATSSSTVRKNSASGTNVKSRAGAENPRFRDQIRKHQNATTGLVASSDAFELGNGNTYGRYVGIVGNIETVTEVANTGVLPFSMASVGVDPTVLAKAQQDASAKVLKKIASIQTPFQGGVVLGELRETLHMIRHPAEALYKLILGEQFLSARARMKRASLRRRRPLSGAALKRSLSKAAADTWLETAFGWKPFISDVEAGLKVYNDLIFSPEYIPFRVTGRSSKPAGNASITNWSVDGFVAYKTIEVKTYESQVYVYGHVRNMPQGIRGKLGLTWGNFIPTIWELLPFSFLVDYFSNVGDVLSGCFVDLGQIAWMSHTRVNSGVNTCKFVDFVSNAGSGPVSPIGTGGHSPVVRRYKEVSRFDSFPVYPPGFRFEFPFGSRKWYNMGALITSVWQSGIPNGRKLRA